MNKNRIYVALAAFAIALTAAAQSERNESLVKSEKNGWEYEVRAGVNIGGAAPIPLPVEIRKIESYSPKFNGVVEGVVTYWLDANRSRFGFSSGIRIEEKGMITEAGVKNYSTQIHYDGTRIAGFYTGRVNTRYNSTLLTIPIAANYRFNDAWKVRAGLFVAYRMDGEFTGSVSDGYLRENTPTGQKIVFEGDASASYDFSKELRAFQWGAQLGGSWRAFKHFTVNADVTYNINGVFKRSFQTITFPLYPIYLNIGFGYRF